MGSTPRREGVCVEWEGKAPSLVSALPTSPRQSTSRRCPPRLSDAPEPNSFSGHWFSHRLCGSGHLELPASWPASLLLPLFFLPLFPSKQGHDLLIMQIGSCHLHARSPPMTSLDLGIKSEPLAQTSNICGPHSPTFS